MINIEPTLNDLQVMQFIHNGYITLENIVDADFNEACESVHRGRMNDFVRTDEFRRSVLLHPEVAGSRAFALRREFSSCRRVHITIFLKHRIAGRRGTPTGSPSTDTVSHISSATTIRKR